MDSKTEEQVRKRRAKPSPTPLNIYQKVLLLGGLLTIFLIAGIVPRMASSLTGNGYWGYWSRLFNFLLV